MKKILNILKGIGIGILVIVVSVSLAFVDSQRKEHLQTCEETYTIKK